MAPLSTRIREVSKSRWSYHPDGYFIRFFPSGYQKTRVDVYVPYAEAVQMNKQKKVTSINEQLKQPMEVSFNPALTVAVPAKYRWAADWGIGGAARKVVR